jgi:hypothetical protein
MGRFEPGGVSSDAISSTEQPTDASSSTFSSSIGIFGLPIKGYSVFQKLTVFEVPERRNVEQRRASNF